MNKFIKRVTTLLVLILSFMAYSQNLKIMTYNIRLDVAVDGENDWSHRKDFFTSQIQFYEPDVFGIQEATPNQVIDISNALSQYNHIGIGREGVGKGESSNIYYKKERFSVSNETTFWLSETPNEISKG
jgi:endonuclease/exonuclease/phosphatase family metal-dependent hydrolase